MHEKKRELVIECANKARQYLIKKYKDEILEGKCKEAADLMIQVLSSRAIKASKHFGWCIYDTCENITGEPCAPHCYVLVHDGRERLYLDCTATQFALVLEKPVDKIILLNSGERPYWFRGQKPTIKEMEEISGY